MKSILTPTLLTLLTFSLSGGARAESNDSLQIYECRYEGIDATGHRMVDLGHIITSDIDGAFETRTLGMQRWDGPSAQVYSWDHGPKFGRKLYLALFDNHDSSNVDGLMVDVGTPSAQVSLSAGGAAASLTCRIL